MQSDLDIEEALNEDETTDDIPVDETLEIYREIFNITSKFYTHKDCGVNVNFEEDDTAFCSSDGNITLPPSLLKNFVEHNLPKFCVYYHELGHALYSDAMFDLLEKWKNLSASGLSNKYKPCYLHLINWVEDFYIEETICKNYTYLKDIIKCLRLLPVNFNIQDIKYAFHYYYSRGCPSPALSFADAVIFDSYMQDLIKLRKDKMFGVGALSLINNKLISTSYINNIIAFYNWCVSKKIFDKDVPMPPLNMPMNELEQINIPINGPGNQGSPDTLNGSGASGSYSEHSHKYITIYKQKFPDLNPITDPIFNEQLKTEKALIERHRADYKVDAVHDNLDGLFTTEYKDTFILAKPNIKSFFNPNRLEDRILFLEPGRVYNNISVYRDISGSTMGNLFTLIDKICKYLIDNVPIDSHFYLYSSGEVSILEAPYVPWPDAHDTPSVYADDPVFKQLGGGTNSDAVADVITEQYSDKWLNVIVTDGDLYALFGRDNIDSLLKNIAIISVGGEFNDSRIDPNHYIHINNESEIPFISDMLINFKEVQ